MVLFIKVKKRVEFIDINKKKDKNWNNNRQ